MKSVSFARLRSSARSRRGKSNVATSTSTSAMPVCVAATPTSRHMAPAVRSAAASGSMPRTRFA